MCDQTKLWELIRPEAGGRLPGELDVLDTGMLRPKKSLLAVFGLTRHLDKARSFAELVPCENCSLAGLPVPPRALPRIPRRKSRSAPAPARR